MKRGIIRVLYGEYGNSYPHHRQKLDNEIENIISNKYTVPFTAYVMGKNNAKAMSDRGISSVLVSESISIASHRNALTNKIICLQHAMEDFDEVVLMDWDCVPIKPLPIDFWEILGRKDVIQCPLYKCTRKVNNWRSGRIPPKLLSGGFFVYTRCQNSINIIYDWLNSPDFKEGNKWADETYYSKYIDDLMGGWQSDSGDYKYQEYLNRFEPLLCDNIRSVFAHQIKEHGCFYHPVKRRV